MPRNANQSKFSNYSMDFDGSSNFINCGTELQNTLNLSKNSISVWFKTSSATSFDTLFAQGFTSSTGYRVYSSGQVLNIFRSENGITGEEVTSVTYNNDTWNHLLIITDTSATNKLTVYLNGTQTGNYSSGNVTYSNSGSNFIIGRQENINQFWVGQIDAVAIFDYALSPNQITTLYGSSSTGIGNPMSLSSAPVAYYPLGDQDAFNGADYLVPNSSLKDYVFDFSSDNIEVDSIGSLFSGITNFSFSGWFNLTSFGGQQVFNILEGNSWKFAINTFNNQLRFNVNPGVAYIANLQNITSTNTWFHYAGVFDGSGASDTDRLKLYINGQPQTVTYYSTTPTSFPTLLSTADISIGGTLAPFNGMTGKASNIQLWTSSLTPSEVTTLYNYGSPIQTLASIPQSSNLKAWYKLDASEVYNSSTTEWSIDNNQNPSAYASSLIFDASSSDYIDCGTGLGNSLGTATSFTVSLWIKAPSTVINDFVFYIGDLLNNYGAITFNIVSNKITIRLNNNAAGFTLNPFTSTDWNNIVFVYDGSNQSNSFIYKNGQQDGLGSGAFPSSLNLSGLKTIIGTGYSTAYSFEGQISNVSVWNAALTTPQVTEIYNNGTPSNLSSHSATSNLVSWWKLNNTTTGIEDSKGSNNGTNNGATEYAGFVNKLAGDSSGMSQANLVQSDLSFTSGYSPYALDFDSASSDYIDCGTGLGNSLGTVTSLSVSVWIKTSHTPLNEFPFYIGNFSNSYGAFNIYTINSAVQIMLNNNAYSVAVQNVNLNDWKNIIFVYDGSNENNSFIYINGQQQNTSGSGTFPSSLNLSGLKTLIGAGYNTPYSFDGQISNASIWNAALTSSQVTEIYNEGVPSNLNNHSAYSNLVSWWQLGNNTSWVDPYWIALDEKGTNNGQSQNVAAPNNMGEDAIVDGVGSYANGLSSGMGGDEVIGDAPYSTANALSVNMDVEDRVTDVPPNFDTSSFLYDGVDEYFSGSSVYSELDGLSNYAVSCWVKSSNYSQNLEILNIELGASNKNFNIKISSNRRVNFAVNFDASYYGYTDTTTLVDNQWFHILATRDNSRAIGDKFRIYINGVNKLEYDSSRFAGTLLSATEPLHIGKKYSSSSNLFDGEIDEVAIYDQDMASYVSEIYAGGKVVNLNNLATAPNPVSYFRSEQATWDGSDWSMKDINSTYTVTSNNMEQADKTTNVP